MKTGKENRSIRFLTLRAVIVIALVLSILTALQNSGVIVKGEDVPAHVVEEEIQGALRPEV